MPSRDNHPTFDVTVSDTLTGHLVSPTGELDLATAPHLEAVVALLETTDGDVVLDLGEITFMDAAGARAVLAAADALGGRLTLRPGQPQVRRLFAVIGLYERLPFELGPHPLG